MNPLEIFIVYIACGAPFGVYFYLQNRHSVNLATVLLKSFLTVFVWIPYALQLLNAIVTKKAVSTRFADQQLLNVDLKENLDALQKRLFQILTEIESGISIFEIREVTERYVGLTLALRGKDFGEEESELLQITNNHHAEVGAKCLRRRNRLRLEFHQMLAARDFVEMLKKFSAFETKNLRPTVLEFVKLLGDGEMLAAFKNEFAATPQIKRDSAVRTREKAVWKSEAQKPSPDRQVLTSTRRHPAMTATANLLSKD